MPAVTITYEINPPADTEAGALSKSKTLEVEVKAQPTGGFQGYYSALEKALIEARDKIGEDLTAWRDAVGNKELNRETKKTLKEDDEEEDDEEEEA
ncbi:hypothetical protein AX16_008590 [Volvariella volvacea WC 439]|nr:hypothetical protein AX16_008590 [Volvariella volvacea WC 439]